MTIDCNSPKFTILPIGTIANSHPDIVVNLLKKYNIPGCVIPEIGFCDKTDCFLYQNYPVPNNIAQTCLCSFLTLLANFELGSVQSMYCLMTKEHSLNIARSTQKIIISLASEGNISNANVNTSQTASVELLPLSNTTVQNGLGNASYESIMNILDIAEKDPDLFSDPISTEIINTLRQYANDNNLESTIQSGVTQAISSISTSIKTITTSEQLIRITINSTSDINEANINLNQQQIVKVLVENIVDRSVGNSLQKLLQDKINNIILNNEYCSIKIPSSPPPPPPKKNKNTLWIILSVLGLCILIIGFRIFFNSNEQPQNYTRLSTQQQQVPLLKKPY
jgi:hypothetical protein